MKPLQSLCLVAVLSGCDGSAAPTPPELDAQYDGTLDTLDEVYDVPFETMDVAVDATAESLDSPIPSLDSSSGDGDSGRRDLGVETADANSDVSDAAYCTEVEDWTRTCNPIFYKKHEEKTLCCDLTSPPGYCSVTNCDGALKGPAPTTEMYLISARCSEAGVVDYTFTLCRPDVEFVDGR